jgi:hypothetical protein
MYTNVKYVIARPSEKPNAISVEIDGVQWFIPLDPANTDYQKYLEWLSEGNEPLPPDPVEGA